MFRPSSLIEKYNVAGLVTQHTKGNPVEHPIPTEIVEKFRPFDVETEEMLYGEELENGMVVLIETRCRIDNVLSESEVELTPMGKHDVLTLNRWCRISKIRKPDENTPDRNRGAISFMGVYADDTQEIRHSGIHTGWVVKKYSIPKLESPAPAAESNAILPDQPIEDLRPR